jgi:hypothetical protein
VRAFVVFVVTYVGSMITLIFTYHAFLERAGVSTIAICLLVLGCIFGGVAGRWRWVRTHLKSFLAASFFAAMTMLLPFLVITYGYALLAFPLVLLWVGMNFSGLKLTEWMRRICRE